MKKLCVLGSVNADHVIRVPYFPKAGETLKGGHYHIAYGGKGANQAVAAARVRNTSLVEVDFIACIGADDIGRAMKQAFVQDGINPEHIVEVADQMTGIAMIQVADSGENSIVISAGANANLDESVVAQHQATIERADCLLVQLETPLQAVEKALKIAKANHTQVILNPAPAQPLSDEILANIDMITPNETETALLTGIQVVDEQTAQQAANVFHQKGIQTVLITLGAKGAFLSENGNGEIIAGFKVTPVDTTAAGDTFNGALAIALLEGKSMRDAVMFAHKASSISVTRMGAQSSIPTRAELV
ncbi:ribokinase [Actinobacillus pleuropneumoniae]|uniref:Ribokinase n=6 Tax=Actinobacillus pleuropneumoniae TaxID=715 RepID=A3N2X1_ACTP2|nr:ribokinase [Actinobacillus pleuropneumoniae]ABN74757.1 ribokinase [Actinobacillus pleuropneumoniae serovar 5b str. L20]ABY70256.1 sugar kinase, ribokinase family [Actinobacillus pleuropneumoniae serovar 3 str. JL03]ACE62385.1 ribokinase [Actinobacillus pleuropneumoniae serovar 7 str. AP76]ASU15520.1 Ribokinase [Actinobacillus pleuropneumoniae]AWG96093.1 ribokinase [Actinobacillus pleuropneumoniae serovar 1 str. 4074]